MTQQIKDEAQNWAEDQILDRDNFRQQIKDAFLQGANFALGNDIAFKKMSDLVILHKKRITELTAILIEIIKLKDAATDTVSLMPCLDKIREAKDFLVEVTEAEKRIKLSGFFDK